MKFEKDSCGTTTHSTTTVRIIERKCSGGYARFTPTSASPALSKRVAEAEVAKLNNDNDGFTYRLAEYRRVSPPLRTLNQQKESNERTR